mmetsp:Transcript_87770/g.171664  ORF Transcript_87770/g.171664 Transcript_87770/m.171664 type:complete len:289 (+) Transcript_87770:211-1077(+)
MWGACKQSHKASRKPLTKPESFKASATPSFVTPTSASRSSICFDATMTAPLRVSHISCMNSLSLSASDSACFMTLRASSRISPFFEAQRAAFVIAPAISVMKRASDSASPTALLVMCSPALRSCSSSAAAMVALANTANNCCWKASSSMVSIMDAVMALMTFLFVSARHMASDEASTTASSSALSRVNSRKAFAHNSPVNRAASRFHQEGERTHSGKAKYEDQGETTTASSASNTAKLRSGIRKTMADAQSKVIGSDQARTSQGRSPGAQGFACTLMPGARQPAARPR